MAAAPNLNLNLQRPAGYVRWQPHGVSTLVWGPDLWRILHALSFLVTARNGDDVARLLTLLGPLLPCEFCRASWPTFAAQLVAAAGVDVPTIVARGAFPRFVYDAHNLVNDKLTRQRFGVLTEALAGPLADRLSRPRLGLAAALAAVVSETDGAYADLDRRPSWLCVLKRYHTAGAVPFDGDAVWRVLLLFTLSYAAAAAPTMLEFLRVLARLLALVPAHAARLTPALVTAADALEGMAAKGVLVDQKAVFVTLALAQARYNGLDDLLADRASRNVYLNDTHARIEAAAAGACLGGVCK